MNFALIMLVLLIITGGIWLLDVLLNRGKRATRAKEPLLVEYARSFFPVILIVFLLRSFLVEPFKIPSGSMIPTLLVGDFILVNKYAYGIRLPVINKKIIDVGDPQRGEVMVFRFPLDPSLDYIKRVVGVPGDRIEYRDKKLTVNGVPVPQERIENYEYVRGGLNYVRAEQYQEMLGSRLHRIIILPDEPVVRLADVRAFPYREGCDFGSEAFTCAVPPGHYFMMGDNRDDSNDSRYWGFVSEQNIVGKAFFVWWNFANLSRIGTSIE